MFVPKSDNEKAKYYLEVAENCRKKGEMYDKLLASGKLPKDEAKDLKEKSRRQWAYHEEYLKSMSELLKAPFPKGETIGDIVEYAENLFK
jgi:hypothetical protein